MSIKKSLIRFNEAMHELQCLFIFFIALLVDFPKKPFRYKKVKSGTLVVLANGPSLKDVLLRIPTTDEFRNVEFSAMNFFACTPSFKDVKPKYYCLVDPMFCMSTWHDDDVKKAFKSLQEDVDWDMTLFIPAYYRISRFRKFSKITNPHINIVVLNSSIYLGKNSSVFRWLFKLGLTIPRFTVAQTCIYTGINMGFDTIRLYGMEHTFFSSLTVNHDCELCTVEEHFYGKNERLKPLLRNDNGSRIKISDFLFQKGHLFYMHDMLSDYAKSVHCKIINYTPTTMIDSYERI